MIEPQHTCKQAKYRNELRIKYFTEPFDGYNWNLCYYEDPKTSIAFHINFCPFCGKELDTEDEN